MGSRVPQVSGCPVPLPLYLSPSAFSHKGTFFFFLFQFDVIDNIMCLDDVLGFINPETQMPNTVLLARAGWVC